MKYTAPADIKRECTFDYVIIGAGGNGSIVANKIAKANPDRSVLLLEAGEKPPDVNIDIWDPKNWVELQHDPTLEWPYMSTCQEAMYGRMVQLARCVALGGSTVHHSFLWVRGGKKSHDDWVNCYGCPGWGWDKLVPYFEKFEAELPGVIGDDAQDSDWEKALVAASVKCGMPWKEDYNQANQDGTSFIRYYPIKDGRRVTMYQIYIEEPKNKTPPELQNLTVQSGAFVTRLLLEQRRTEHAVYAVQYTPYSDPQSGPVTTIKVSREVIMTAGAIGNPQILNLSGIGDPEELKRAGIKPIVELPGVGKNLVDDVFVINNYSTTKELPEGFMSNGIGGVINFVGKFQITNQSTRMPGLFNIAEEWKPGFQIGMDVHEIKSRGYVHLDKENLYGVPIINLNYLKEEEDLDACVEALTMLRKVGNSAELNPWGPTEVMPRPEVKDDNKEALRCYIRATSGTTFHYSGTCRMGTPDVGPFTSPPVVDPGNLKVYGFRNLRIMDASIFPQNPNGNPQATSYCVADIGAEMVINDM